VAFLTEAPPRYGEAEPILPWVRRVVAPNPGPMTYHGTNSWLIETGDGVIVLDPGPDDATHVAALMQATGGRVARILLTHTHPDHVGAAAALKAATGAPTLGFAPAWHKDFQPDIALQDGDTIAGLTALHTPGHASDHLCFAGQDGVLFSGDHVMSWNTSIVSPPDGDMDAYMEGLRRLLARDDALYLGGHGPPLRQPQSLVRAMLGHRMSRESAILACLGPAPHSVAAIVDSLYAGLDAGLKRAAERTVLAHLLKLAADGRAEAEGPLWRTAKE
jgi:glyoxylase-like metal-dependent hydrolase (beta-lactamase superfamily II)